MGEFTQLHMMPDEAKTKRPKFVWLYFTSPEAQAKSAFSLGVLPQFSQNDESVEDRAGTRSLYSWQNQSNSNTLCRGRGGGDY